MCEYLSYIIEKTSLDDSELYTEVKEFVEKSGLALEESIELTVIIRDPYTRKIIATGSLDKGVLKDICVDPSRRGEGLSDKVVSQLMIEGIMRGYKHLFIFTNTDTLHALGSEGFAGFLRIAETDDMALLEWGIENIKDYITYLSQFKKEVPKKKGIISAIVVNCNPFTYGHQYLIETAAKESDLVYVIVVSEDRSMFPTKIRLELVKKGTAHLPNVVVLEGGRYVISSATFPTYFMKDYKNITYSQAKLDVTVFLKYIVPTLGINRRYVGTEPYCPVTSTYNKAMREILEPNGVELVEVPRKEINGKAISASTVRRYIKEDRIEELKELVPPTTYEFLVSNRPEANEIIAKIKASNSRH